MRTWLIASVLACLIGPVLVQSQEASSDLHVPAFTGYLVPDTRGARVGDRGITRWGGDETVLWGGILTPGEVKASVSMRLPEGETATLKLTIAGTSHQAELKGTGSAVPVAFGAYTVSSEGYQRIELSGVRKSGRVFGDVLELVLSGPATKGAFFNLTPRRNAASVHLWYTVPRGTEVAWFYNELVPKTDPVTTYYMACGFARGYFGIQVNSPTERRIIFSVWDAGNEGVDRNKVVQEDRVTLLAKGPDVVASGFGNEGTGGHSHLSYMWKTGEKQRFLVTAKVDGGATIYSGYYYFNDRKSWGLIASFKAPHDGKLLRGLYSFNENFWGNNGYERRLCEFGNQWIRTDGGRWIELTTASFTHDAAGGRNRRDYGSGVAADGSFYLSNGGFVAEPVKYGQHFTRPATGKPPTDIDIK